MTTGRDRDRVVEDLLRRTLRENVAASTAEPCPDAETLAAWFDGGLDDGERAAVMSHAAACARCQAALGVLAHTAPVEAAEPPWWKRQWKAWLVPLTAAATAVTLWMVVPGQRSVLEPESASPKPATVSRESGTENRQLETPSREPGAELGARPQLGTDRADSRAPTPQAAPESSRQKLAARGAEPIGGAAAESQFAPPPPVPQPPREVAGAPPARAAESAVDAAAGARPQLKREAEATAGGGAPSQVRERSNAVETPRAEDAQPRAPASAAPAPRLGQAAAAPPPAAAAPAPAVAGGAQGQFAKQAVARDAVSPDPLVRWRWDDNVVQRSSDAGATWESIQVPRAAGIVAAAAPSREICWFVGRGGLVLRTVDGRRFEELPFPEKIDLVGVKAADARGASVTAIDGRVFTTADGGRSWAR